MLNRHVNELSLINRNIGLVVATSEHGSYDYGYGYGYGYGNDYSYGERNGGGNGKGGNGKAENILKRIKEKLGPYHKN